MTSSGGEPSLTELWQRMVSALEHVAVVILDPATTMDQLTAATEQVRDAGAGLNDGARVVRDRGVCRLDAAFADALATPLARVLYEGMPGGSDRARSVPLPNRYGMRFVGVDEAAVLAAAAEWFGEHPQQAVLALAWHYSGEPYGRGEAILTVFTDAATSLSWDPSRVDSTES